MLRVGACDGVRDGDEVVGEYVGQDVVGVWDGRCVVGVPVGAALVGVRLGRLDTGAADGVLLGDRVGQDVVGVRLGARVGPVVVGPLEGELVVGDGVGEINTQAQSMESKLLQGRMPWYSQPVPEYAGLPYGPRGWMPSKVPWVHSPQRVVPWALPSKPDQKGRLVGNARRSPLTHRDAQVSATRTPSS